MQSFKPGVVRRERKTPWSREGCRTCKRRHKKCDGNKPICNTCARLRLECEQPDAFRVISVAETAGRAPKRAKPNSPASSACDKQCLNDQPRARPKKNRSDSEAHPTTESIAPASSDLKSETCQQLRNETLSPLSLCGKPSPCLLIGYLPMLSDNEWQYLQYYVEKLSDLLLNAYGPRNPLRDLILPRIVSSPMLIHAICSVSAQHRAASANYGRGRDTHYDAATKYYVSVLSTLKQWLPYISSLQEAGHQDPAVLETALLSTIFMCKHEIFRGGEANWKHHMSGIEFFCQLMDQVQSSSGKEIAAFAHSFIVYHKSIATITEKAAPNPSVVLPRREMESQRNSPYSVDPYMGFSKSLIGTLQRVSTLATLEATCGYGLEYFKSEVMSIVEILDGRVWASQLIDLPSELSPTTVDHLKNIARAYECAILAYLQSVVDDISPRYGNPSTCDDLYELFPTSKPEAIADCLGAISNIPIGAREEPGLLPLLFIVACIAESAEQTWEVLQRVHSLYKNFGLGHIQSTSVLVHEMWLKRMELENWHDWRGLLVKFNWELFVG